MEDVASPIKDLLSRDVVYGEYETDVSHQFREVIYLIQGAFAKEANPEKANERNECRNALQGIMECLESHRFRPGKIEFDYMNDIMKLAKHTDVLRDAADIHERFMGNRTQAQALRTFSDNVDAANKRTWMPVPQGLDFSAAAANDERLEH